MGRADLSQFGRAADSMDLGPEALRRAVLVVRAGIDTVVVPWKMNEGSTALVTSTLTFTEFSPRFGLTYTLALSAASGTGNGATQTYNVNGSMAANQIGTCATGVCNGSQTRTLTLTW